MEASPSACFIYCTKRKYWYMIIISRLSPGWGARRSAPPGDTASIASRCIRFPGADPFGSLWGFGSTALDERCVLLSVALMSDAPGGSCSGRYHAKGA